jgi:hypothetical protein
MKGSTLNQLEILGNLCKLGHITKDWHYSHIVVEDVEGNTCPCLLNFFNSFFEFDDRLHPNPGTAFGSDTLWSCVQGQGDEDLAQWVDNHSPHERASPA